MPHLKIGDRVRWAHAAPDAMKQDAVGSIVAILASDSGLDEFALYEVQFPFGIMTLYRTQIDPDQPQRPGFHKAGK